jgi:hypothetical protein
MCTPRHPNNSRNRVNIQGQPPNNLFALDTVGFADSYAKQCNDTILLNLPDYLHLASIGRNLLPQVLPRTRTIEHHFQHVRLPDVPFSWTR